MPKLKLDDKLFTFISKHFRDRTATPRHRLTTQQHNRSLRQLCDFVSMSELKWKIMLANLTVCHCRMNNLRLSKLSLFNPAPGKSDWLTIRKKAVSRTLQVVLPNNKWHPAGAERSMPHERDMNQQTHNIPVSRGKWWPGSTQVWSSFCGRCFFFLLRLILNLQTTFFVREREGRRDGFVRFSSFSLLRSKLSPGMKRSRIICQQIATQAVTLRSRPHPHRDGRLLSCF